MPFQSEAQRRYLWANEPKIARDWADTYGSRIEKNDGGITQLVKSGPGRPGYGGPHETEKAGKSYEAAKAKGPGGAERWQQQAIQTHRKEQREAGKGAQQRAAEREAKAFKKQQTSKGGKFKQITSNSRKNELRKLFDYIHGGRKFQMPSVMSSIARKADWDDEGYLDWNPRGASLHGDMSEKDLTKLQDIQTALGQGNLSQTAKFKGDEKFAFEDFYPNMNPPPQGGDGQGGGYMGYPSYAAWLAAQGGGGGGGGGGTTTPTPDTPSAFQQSLTTNAGTPGYYVGNDPTASNIAWGKQMGVDPRTMGRTSWAANGGRIPAAFGGIMDSSTGRRAYGFGSIFKKIGRAAKKVFKSPIGKAALLGGLGMYAGGLGPWAQGGMWQGKMGSGFLKGALAKGTQLGPQATKGGWLRNIFSGGKGALDSGWNPWKIGIGAASALPFFMGGQEEDEGSKFDYDAAKNKYWDELRGIKKGVHEGTLNPHDWSYLPSDYTYTGRAEGGRIGLYSGGQSTPSDYTMEDARKTTMQDKMGGITDSMKRADLSRQGDVGQMYMANGGSPSDTPLMDRVKELQDEGLDLASAIAQAIEELQSRDTNAQGGRIGAEEGGLMDLGGMEKDYRNDGGFVPLGGEEKADDVPARLSKNEFVFTADAVRGAGDGDIDKGAEIMENIMKNLEQGGQISEETQGLSGAQEMFGVSERLSEVV